jgi:hypothetical protein
MYHRRETTRERRFRVSRVKRVLAAALVSALMLTTMAAPALAIVHDNTPADECGQAAVAGGEPAAGAVSANNPVDDPPMGKASAPTPAAC